MRNPVPLFIVTAVLAVMCARDISAAEAAESNPAPAQDSLKKHAFPWYDAQSDRFRPMAPTDKPDPPPEKKSDRPQPSNDSVDLLQLFQKILLWSLLIAVVTTFIIVAARTWRGTGSQVRSPSIAATVSLEALEALPEPVRQVRDLLAEADRLASQSAYSQAILFYYSWQLVQLDQRQYIELQKGKTNRGYLREVSQSVPDLIDVFASSLRQFEDAFFGHLEISRENFLNVWEQRRRYEFQQRGGRS